MGEIAKEWMIGKNMDFWDKGVSDGQIVFHDNGIFVDMAMKIKLPNQGRHGLLFSKEKMPPAAMEKIYSTR
jgi:hypothetical protein